MEFEVNSAYFSDLNKGRPRQWLSLDDDYSIGLNKYLEVLRPYTFIKNKSLFMAIDSLEQLECILLELKSNFSSIKLSNDYCWAPDEIIIDFEYKRITFRDSYIE